MAFLGNRNGPRESLVASRLGHDYFGTTPALFEEEFDNYEYSEQRGEVQPVHVDERGEVYVEMKTNHPHYLKDEDGLDLKKWIIEGGIETFTQEEADRLKKEADRLKKLSV